MAKVLTQLKEGIPTGEKIARLFAMHLIKDIEDKEERALTLSGVGFGASDIAEMLRVGKNYLNVASHRRKKNAWPPSGNKRKTLRR